MNSWLGDANRLQTNYEIVVRDLLPSDLVASELSRRLDGELHALLVSIIARVADREQPDIRQIADELSARFETARDISEDGSEIDLHDLGPFPEIQDLLSAVIDTELLSELLAEEMVAARSEEIQDLVLIDQRTDTPVSPSLTCPRANTFHIRQLHCLKRASGTTRARRRVFYTMLLRTPPGAEPTPKAS